MLTFALVGGWFYGFGQQVGAWAVSRTGKASSVAGTALHVPDAPIFSSSSD
jgi:hypothetical protein